MPRGQVLMLDQAHALLSFCNNMLFPVILQFDVTKTQGTDTMASIMFRLVVTRVLQEERASQAV